VTTDRPAAFPFTKKGSTTRYGTTRYELILWVAPC